MGAPDAIPQNDQRHFSDEEVALILRRAAEEREPGGIGTTADGLSLAQVQEIGREVGIDPAAVARAAAAVAAGRITRQDPFDQSTTHAALTLYEGRTLAPAEVRTLVETVRDLWAHQGDVRETMGAVEWRTVGEVSQVAVTVAPSPSGTSVRIRVDRSGSAVLTGFLPTMAGLVIAAVTGATLEPGVIGGVGLVVAGGGAGLVAGRAIWNRNTRALRQRIRRLLSALQTRLQAHDSAAD